MTVFLAGSPQSSLSVLLSINEGRAGVCMVPCDTSFPNRLSLQPVNGWTAGDESGFFFFFLGGGGGGGMLNLATSRALCGNFFSDNCLDESPVERVTHV